MGGCLGPHREDQSSISRSENEEHFLCVFGVHTILSARFQQFLGTVLAVSYPYFPTRRLQDDQVAGRSRKRHPSRVHKLPQKYPILPDRLITARHTKTRQITGPPLALEPSNNNNNNIASYGSSRQKVMIKIINYNLCMFG